MHTDKYGLPTQANGDANDQLARVAMLAIQNTDIKVALTAIHALHVQLRSSPGVYIRYVGADPRSTSADQLISVMAAFTIDRFSPPLVDMFIRCIGRFGFAQNTRNTLDGSNSKQIPDFMLLRALPLLTRVSKGLYPFAILTDFLLVLAAIAAVGPVWKDGSGFSKRTPDDVDDNVLILTLIACRTRMVTPLSWLACKIYAKFRPWNYGCALGDPNGQDSHHYHPVVGALRWYHRADSGGNPEVAEAVIPFVKEFILK